MRTTLDIPAPLIEEARRLLGFKSKTDTVVLSLQELIRRRRIEELKSMLGSVQLEIALPNGCNDLAHTFQALTKCEEKVISAVVSRMRRDGGEPSLYLRVAGEDIRQVEKQLREAAVIMLAPEGR